MDKQWYGILFKNSFSLGRKNLLIVGIYFVLWDNLSFEALIMYSLLCFGIPFLYSFQSDYCNVLFYWYLLHCTWICYSIEGLSGAPIPL